ncbi:MAG: terminase large subunit domain-containing protein [Promethearchaeota archaeon]
MINNPIALFTLLFDKPFEYQRKLLLSNSKRITFRSGRQVGKTTIAAGRAIHHALSHENRQVLIVSPTQRQSSIMFRKIRSLLKHRLIFDEIESESQTMITFKNGSEIHSLPGNNPDTIRGFSPTKSIVDEAAFVKDELFVALEPSLAATNGGLEMYSSPFGKRGRFYNSFDEEGFEKYHIKSKESPLITDEFLQNARKSKTELEYLQEYEGEFLEEQDTYFSRELILNSIEDLKENYDPEHCNYYLGVDCARYGLDETVYTIAEIDGKGIIRIRKIINTSKKPLTDVIGRVKALDEQWKFHGIYIDSSGLGAGAVDSLIEAGLPIKNIQTSSGNISDSVQFTLQNKEEIYKNLKLIMEQEKIKYPNNDKLIRQMCDLQYEYTEAGHLKLHHPDKGHDDFPDSLALAVAFCIKPSYSPYIAI